MKKLFFLSAFILLSLTPFAQKGKDYITKKPDGKVYWIRGGQTIQMAIDVPLKDGSTVNSKGDIKDSLSFRRRLSAGFWKSPDKMF